MKIKSIEVKNYKAFLGKYKININGKNAFIYGENGSGKSSLYYALKDFFQSSIESIDLSEVENIFIKPVDRGNSSIKVVFNPNKDGARSDSSYTLTSTSKDTNSTSDTSIKDANTLKSFLTYKHLLDIHHIKKGGEIDLFDLLVRGVLKHFKYTLTGGKELGEMWAEIEELIGRETNSSYPKNQKKREVDSALRVFNTAFKQLFEVPTATSPNPEYILDHAGPILEEFEHGLGISLRYLQASPSADYKSIIRNNVHVDLTFAGKPIPKPHLFLNEARLSAIAISIYLGMIKRHPQLRKYKILFLDDIFIGLDISNRLPLLRILESHFPEYQVFITTYDKPWYEYVKGILRASWKTIEIYAQEVNGGYVVPKIDDDTDLISKAQKHLDNCDYKACAVYARSAFEKIIIDYCEKKRKALPFKRKFKDYSSQDFWAHVKADVQAGTVTSVEGYRFLVYNKLSHYDPETNPVNSELRGAINAVRNLKSELAALAATR